MAILIRAQRSARHERDSYLQPSEGPTYVLFPPSGALSDWASPSSYDRVRRSKPNLPATMMQPFTFDDNTDTRVEVVHFRPVDEDEDSW
jgi:hypothetical protein